MNVVIPQFNQNQICLGIERMQKMFNAMGEPCAKVNAIQIAGTNGKGSIASFIQSVLTIAGIKTGITTSPHLVSWNERICINQDKISSFEFQQRLKSIHPLAKKYQLTPFEFILAIAYEHFADNDVQLLVLEVGLGGRLDATTVHPLRPVIAMAGIGLDHSEYLGNTLTQIAQEKAAVITPGSQVISAVQHPEVENVLITEAKRKNAQIHWVDPLPKNWELGISGEIQRENGAVAQGALKALTKIGWNINEQAIRTGLEVAKWPGRLQQSTWKGKPLLIDSAHNPHAAKQLSKERCYWKNHSMGVLWVFAIQTQKDAPTMLRYLLEPKDTVWIVPISNHACWTKSELSKACPEFTNQLFEAKHVDSIFKNLIHENQWPKGPIVISGSLYLIGDLLSKGIITPTI